jgi:hypothetical protein
MHHVATGLVDDLEARQVRRRPPIDLVEMKSGCDVTEEAFSREYVSIFGS